MLITEPHFLAFAQLVAKRAQSDHFLTRVPIRMAAQFEATTKIKIAEIGCGRHRQAKKPVALIMSIFLERPTSIEGSNDSLAQQSRPPPICLQARHQTIVAIQLLALGARSQHPCITSVSWQSGSRWPHTFYVDQINMAQSGRPIDRG